MGPDERKLTAWGYLLEVGPPEIGQHPSASAELEEGEIVVGLGDQGRSDKNVYIQKSFAQVVVGGSTSCAVDYFDSLNPTAIDTLKMISDAEERHWGYCTSTSMSIIEGRIAHLTFSLLDHAVL